MPATGPLRLCACTAPIEAASRRRWRRGCDGRKSLYDTGKTFEFIICEAALRYLLCPAQVMAGQLDRLLGVLRAR